MKRIVSLCLCVIFIFVNAPEVSAETNCYGWEDCHAMDPYDYISAGSPFYYKDWQVINSINGNARIIPFEEVSYTLGGTPIYNGYIFTYKDEGKSLVANWKGRKVTHTLNGTSIYTGMRYDMLSQPTKVKYKVGDAFDSSGFSAKFKMSSKGPYKDVMLSPEDVTFTTIASFIGYDGKKTGKYHQSLSDINRFAVPGTYRVVAEYTPMKDVVLGESFIIEVEGSTSSKKPSLHINTLPRKLDYVIGEKFKTKGFSAVYTKNGVTKRLSAKDVKFKSGVVIKDGRPFQEAGNKKVIVSYKDAKTSFNLTVVRERISSKIKIPKKTTYYVGEPFDTSGFLLEYTDSKGKRKVKAKDVKFTSGSVIYHGRPFQQAGKKEVIMTYRSAYEKFYITVLPAK